VRCDEPFGARSLLVNFAAIVNLERTQTSRFERLVFMGAMLLHAVTAWFSTGFHTDGEHHQVIGCAEAWLGELPVSEHTWEYADRIRPSAMPWVAVGVIETCRAVGLTSPFPQAFLLRMLSALFALFVVRHLVRSVRNQLPQDLHRAFLVISYLLWFLPFLHVRFASETWAGLCLVMAISSLLRAEDDRWWTLRVGVWLALAAWIRPATLPAIAGVVLWMIVIRGSRVSELLRLGAAAGTLVLVSGVLDSLFYSTPTLSLWGYVDVNFPSHPEHVYDTLPWYYYAPWLVKYAIPPIGACILFSLALLLWKNPRHILLWCVAPMVIALSIVPHKELRFIYPLADLVPWLLLIGFAELRIVLRPARGLVIGTLVVLVVCNVLGLAVSSLTPSGNGRAHLAQAIHTDDRGAPVHIVYAINNEDAWRILLPHFYRPENTLTDVVPPIDTIAMNRPIHHVIGYQRELQAMRSGPTGELIARSDPAWSVSLLDLYYWGEWKGPLELRKIPKQ